MLFKRKPARLFYIPEPVRFKTTKLDIFVVTVVFIVWIWAFLIDSFRPLLNETGVPIFIITDRGVHYLNHVNMQFFIAPLIFCYEILVLIGLDGKKKGRSLPWGLYYMTFKIRATNKLKEGIREYREWINK